MRGCATVVLHDAPDAGLGAAVPGRSHGPAHGPARQGRREISVKRHAAAFDGARPRHSTINSEIGGAAGLSRAPFLRDAHGLMTPHAARALAVALVCAAAARAGEPGLAFDVRAEFARYDPTYAADRKAARAPLPTLTEKVRALEASGDPATRCAQERLTELRITSHDTADFAEARAETAALERLLAVPESETAADGPDAEGAWGRCYSRWYLRLDASYDVVSERTGPLYVPARFLDRVNGPEALGAYLRGLSVSDIATEGVDHRRELNYAVSALMRLILHDQPQGYPWAPGIKTRFGTCFSTNCATRPRAPGARATGMTASSPSCPTSASHSTSSNTCTATCRTGRG